MRKDVQHPIAVLGLPLNSYTAGEAVDAMERLILSGGTHQVATANVDFWLNSLEDQHLHRILASCSLVLSGGMPLVWASKLLGNPLPERVTGVDLVPRLAELSARKGYKIFLLGGKEGVAARATALLEQKFPGVRIVGSYAPVLKELARMDHGEILRRVHEAQPDILLVAFGNPKQEKWIWMHRKKLGVPLAMGIGGSLDILVGDVWRAPRWIERCGMEWLVRFLQEPARLGPQYIRNLTGLAQRLPEALLAAWSQQPYQGPCAVTTARDSSVMHIYVHGKLTRETTPPLQRAIATSIADNLMVIVHLKTVGQMDPAGLGFLMDARRQLFDAGLSLGLADVSKKLRFLLHAWCSQPLFHEWHPSRPHSELLAPEPAKRSFINLSSEQEALSERVRAR
jgi:N-acetylglucosaminyldiphosphoundecaprenol N-acetyl-beta-D-mannosaminyltransferase